MKVRLKTAVPDRSLIDDWTVEFPKTTMVDQRIGLRDLIAHIVTAQTEICSQRKHSTYLSEVLSSDEIAAGIQRGVVRTAGLDRSGKPVNQKAATASALQAFDDGLYLVVVDDQPIGDLDSLVKLQPDSTITFLRLVMLVGG